MKTLLASTMFCIKLATTISGKGHYFGNAGVLEDLTSLMLVLIVSVISATLNVE